MTSRWSARLAREAGGAGAKLWTEILEITNAAGVVNLGQGFPDFVGSEVAVTSAVDGLKAPAPNQYSPIAGLPKLHSSIANLYKKLYDDTITPSKEICVITSATEALLGSCLAFVDEGDEVVIFEPFFPWYLPSVRMAGGIPKVVQLRAPDWKVTKEDLERVFSPKTKMVIINTPHNPTGRVLTPSELEMIASYCKKYDAICVSDEVYEVATFSGHKHHRMTDQPGMRERTLTIGGASKMLSLTGWRVGWVYGPEDLVAGIRTVHSFATYCAPTPFQVGCSAAIDDAIEKNDFTFGNIADKFQTNWELLADALKTMPGVSVCEAQGGHFLIADIAKSGKADVEFCRWLAQEKKVGCIPLSMCYSPRPNGEDNTTDYVRFAICKERACIEAAVKNLLK
eukprot:TRINITY_DN7666_c0_g1_i1.p1 TRINITY_DN7666_c0_g1~~TRINITY_DN7666_c0_g1_i1.p1  ORF type:complete len:397 (+),score=73.64 TRINITY_DN7666_c0_g1_i1:48-1238(+)